MCMMRKTAGVRASHSSCWRLQDLSLCIDPHGQGTRRDARTQKVTKSVLEHYLTGGCLCKSKACLIGNGSFAPGDRKAGSCLPIISLSEDARDFVAMRLPTSVKVQTKGRDQGAFPF